MDVRRIPLNTEQVRVLSALSAAAEHTPEALALNAALTLLYAGQGIDGGLPQGIDPKTGDLLVLLAPKEG